MPTARHKTVDPERSGVYHCISRCVRRCFLCGSDPITGKNFEHRKAWIEGRLKFLAQVFEFPVYSYAVMSNHLHIVLRTKPEAASNWAVDKIVAKAYSLCPQAVSRSLGAGQSLEAMIQCAVDRPEYVELWRQRFKDLSWFMRFLNENIARRANKEEQIRGRFWEGRFHCKLLADEGAVLSCMAYVDLNPVRAGLGEKPEDYPFTSIFRRIEARQGRQALQALESGISGVTDEVVKSAHQRVRSAEWLFPVDQIDVGEGRSRWGLSEDDYLSLVDFAGRALIPGKEGSIPVELSPILERLDLNTTQWIQTVKHYGSLYWRVAGCAEILAELATRFGQRWFRRRSDARFVYLKT